MVVIEEAQGAEDETHDAASSSDVEGLTVIGLDVMTSLTLGFTIGGKQDSSSGPVDEMTH